MRRAWCLLCLSGLLLGGGLLRSGEQGDVQKILDQAIKAHGGEEKLSKLQAATIKEKGTFFGLGKPVPYTGESAVDGKDKIRTIIEGTVKGETFKVVLVVNGKKGWIQIGGKTKALDKAELLEERTQMYADWVASLAPLRKKGFKLSPVGEVQVGGKPAVGIRVERDGRPAVSLFFDKKNHRLVKSEFAIPDAKAGGKEVLEEIIFKDYKDFQGVPHPTRILIDRDGKRYVDSEVTDLHLQEHLDESLFARPQ